MTKNMGSADRIIRLIIAAVLAVLYFTGVVSGTIATVALVVAVVFLLTSAVGTCGLYMPFGISTCKTKSS